MLCIPVLHRAGHSPPGPELSWNLLREVKPGSYSAAQNPPFHAQKQHKLATDRAKADKHAPALLPLHTPPCSVPALTRSWRHPQPATGSQDTVLGPLLAFAAAPTGYRLPSRCAALSEISILGCRKVYLRRARGIPAERLKMGFHAYIWFSLKNLA